MIGALGDVDLLFGFFEEQSSKLLSVELIFEPDFGTKQVKKAVRRSMFRVIEFLCRVLKLNMSYQISVSVFIEIEVKFIDSFWTRIFVWIETSTLLAKLNSFVVLF